LGDAWRVGIVCFCLIEPGGQPARAEGMGSVTSVETETGIGTEVESEPRQPHSPLVNFSVRISELENRLKYLQGQLEELLHRMTQLEQKHASVQGKISPVHDPFSFQGARSGEKKAEGALSEKEGTKTVLQLTLPSLDIQQEYERARNFLEQGHVSQACAALEVFIKNNSQHPACSPGVSGRKIEGLWMRPYSSLRPVLSKLGKR